MRSNAPESGWSPDGWADFVDRYPNTPDLPDSASSGVRHFSNIWQSSGVLNRDTGRAIGHLDDTLVVLVRGIFGNLMPGNFVPVLRYFRHSSVQVIRPRCYTMGTIEESAGHLFRQIRPALESSQRILWLCQSRGGLDAMWAIREYPELREKTSGLVAVQTPSDRSEIMQSVVKREHAASGMSLRSRASEQLQRAVLGLPAFRDGALQLTSPAIDRYVEALRREAYSFPFVSVATWSVEPTSWVDSFHRRLGEIRPGCAHDGQFFIEDQLWTNALQLVLGRIDHAQSVMGGRGFPLVRFWDTLATLACELRESGS